MMKQFLTAAAFGLGAIGMAQGAWAGPTALAVDGSLTDWNVNIGDATGCVSNAIDQCVGTNWGGTPGVNQGTNVQTFANNKSFVVQDANDATSAEYGGAPGLLAPYFGGQNFDAEFLGVAQSGTKLYVSIMTGQRPDNGLVNGLPTYEPGDLRILVLNSKTNGHVGGTNNGTSLGVELGQSSASGFGNGNIGTTSGTTFNLTTTGTLGLVQSTSTTSWKVGEILKGATFAPGVLGAEATQLTGGTSAGFVEQLIETGNTVSGQHQVIEFVIDLVGLLGITDTNTQLTGNQLSFEWGPGCGNDLTTTILTSAQGDIRTPEPAGLALFGLGMLGLGFVRRRKSA